MKTLDQHNADRTQDYNSGTQEILPSGLACPKCGEELVYANWHVILTSLLPKKRVECRCGFAGHAIV